MKVVIFCGGMGMRLREYSEAIPKPMVPVGYRPIMWHVMRYYAHFGHKDFILCLGYKADAIKRYFLNYDETISNDFVMTEGGRVDLLGSDIHDWKITFVDTGLYSNIGQRLMRARPFLEGEELFLANYADVLTDIRLPDLIEYSRERSAVACFAGVAPSSSFHIAESDDVGRVKSIRNVRGFDLRVNGGYFVFNKSLFEYIHEGEELVEEPFNRLAAEGRLFTYRHDGFWACMDTFKERELLEDLHSRNQSPWEVWRTQGVEKGNKKG